MRTQRLIGMVNNGNVLRVIHRPFHEAGLCQQVLNVLITFFGEDDRALFLVEVIILIDQLRNDRINLTVKVGAVICRAGNDQRRTRFVDQNGVDLVHDTIIVSALNHVVQGVFHIVAKIVETEFVVRAVCDVTGISFTALAVIKTVNNRTGFQAKEAVNLVHPLCVTAGEVIVHRDDVNTFAFERIQISRERCDKGFTLTCTHLCDIAGMEDHAANELYVEMPHTHGTLRRLTHNGERFFQNVVQRRAIGQLLFEFGGFTPERTIRKRFNYGLHRIDPLNARPVRLNLTLVRGSE